MTHTLEFLSGQVHYALINGEWWFHVGSICATLDVDFKQQKKNISSSPVLGPGGCVHTLQLGSDQARKHYMINERRLSAWLFNVRSESRDLLAFQVELADRIFEITRGQVVPISAAALARREANEQAARFEKALAGNADYEGLKRARAKARAASARISTAANLQASLFN